MFCAVIHKMFSGTAAHSSSNDKATMRHGIIAKQDYQLFYNRQTLLLDLFTQWLPKESGRLMKAEQAKKEEKD